MNAELFVNILDKTLMPFDEKYMPDIKGCFKTMVPNIHADVQRPFLKKKESIDEKHQQSHPTPT